jgi:site-specific DNA-methyltransferase (adenine-specific)/modification methylase
MLGWPNDYIDKIIHGDCLKLMREIPDNSIDLVFTDPPYNISRDTVITRNGGKYGKAKPINLDFGEWDHNVITPYEWIPETYRLLKPNGVLIFFYDRMKISQLAEWLIDKFDMVVRHIGVWHKTNPAPQARKVKWQVASEFFIIATKNHGTGHHYNYREGQHHDVITTPICQGKERYDHPTQKPEALAEPIIRW